MTLDIKILTLIIQCICLFVLTSLLGLSEIRSTELTANNVVSQIGKWAVFLLPMSLLGLQYNYNGLFQYTNIILFVVNFIVWVIFSSSYTAEVKSKRSLDYSFGAITFTSIWILIGVVKFVGDNQYFQFAIEPLNQFESIHYLLNLKTIFFIAFGVYCIVYVVSNIGGEDNPTIPKIPSSSVDTDTLTRKDWMNSIFLALQYSLNVLIAVLNPLSQFIGTVLAYFLYIIPKLIWQLILRLGKLSLLTLPSIVILIALLFLIYLVRENANELVNYIQNVSREESKVFIKPILIYGVLSLLGVISIQLVNYLSFKETEFSLNLLPFSFTYFLFLLTIGGWAVWGLGKIKISDLQLGYYTITMSALMVIGIVVLVILQLNSKGQKESN